MLAFVGRLLERERLRLGIGLHLRGLLRQLLVCGELLVVGLLV